MNLTHMQRSLSPDDNSDEFLASFSDVCTRISLHGARSNVALIGPADSTAPILAALADQQGSRLHVLRNAEDAGAALFSLVHITLENAGEIEKALQRFHPRLLPGGGIVIDLPPAARTECSDVVDDFFAKTPDWVQPLGMGGRSVIARKPRTGCGSAVATSILIGLVEHFGDIIACEPIARHLKATYPGATIGWVVRTPYRELLDSNPYVDAVIEVNCLTEWMILKKHGQHEKVIDLHVNYRVCPCCGIPLIKDRGNAFVDSHTWLEHGSLLESFSLGAGLPKISDQPAVYIQEAQRRRVDALRLPEQFCVVHRRSNDPDKDWTDARWRDLISWLCLGLHLPVVEIGLGEADPAEMFGPDYLDLRCQTGLLETAELIGRACLFIGIDSGPAHAANAVGTPGVILLGRYRTSLSYTPFSGFYATNTPDVRLVRNPSGPVREIELATVQEAIEYILAFVAERDAMPARRAHALPVPATRLPVPPAATAAPQQQSLPKVLAFYLPQFHPIPENNAAHGPGFTEWTNVLVSKPLFKGHYQPRQAGELGYYDLRSVEVLRAQAELARSHGITGFCFYYYYFEGRRLLYKPIENFINSDIDMPFCFLWANENWSKRWDGGDNEVIIAQNHSQVDDLIFLRNLYPVFNDPRYVRIGDKPVLLVYKPHLFPDIRTTIERWREEIVSAGFQGLYLVMVEDWSAADTHPALLGFDASYEIPSNITPHFVEDPNRGEFEFTGEFSGRIVDYWKFAGFHANRPNPEYKRFKTVMAPWDNTARYRANATIHVNTDNDAYRLWMTKSYLDTYRRFAGDERMMFIHSWNEWCEGTYIEPDGRSGRKYLEQTRDGIADAIQLIREAEQIDLDLDAASLANRLGREREEFYRVILKNMREQADQAWQSAHDERRMTSHWREEATRWREEYRAVERSTSWRVTQPLRATKELLQRLRRRSR